MKADHNTITPFGVKVMSTYKVLSKCEHGVIKRKLKLYCVLSMVIGLFYMRHVLFKECSVVFTSFIYMFLDTLLRWYLQTGVRSSLGATSMENTLPR